LERPLPEAVADIECAAVQRLQMTLAV